MKRIAVLGAGGFVGARFVELATLNRLAHVVPVIRSPKSVARLARLGCTWVMADAGVFNQLRTAIKDCDAVVNLTIGEFDEMGAATDNIWRACAAEGVPRFIHLSSAEVFGQAHNPAINDDSPPLRDHWMPYARAKIAAEERLQLRLADPRVICIVLRPGLIWGPRSSWVEEPARQLIDGTAFLIEEGRGVCNLLYLDNLIYSILGAIEHPEPVSGFYNVADDDLVSWRDYYAALSTQIGVDSSKIHQLPTTCFHPRMESLWEKLKATEFYQSVKRNLNKPVQERLKRLLGVGQLEPPSIGPIPEPKPFVTRKEWHLQNTRHKLPTEKFNRTFGRCNRYSFNDAIAQTGQWLQFAGYTRQVR